MPELNILKLASENGALRGGKVGGIGDMVRDSSAALGALGCRVTIATPSYGFLHSVEGAERLARVGYSFAGGREEADVVQVPGERVRAGVRHVVIDHPEFESYDEERQEHRIYVHDPDGLPFATDATKFARFCIAAAQAVKDGVFGPIDCIHLHDWHGGAFPVLQHFHPDYMGLRQYRTVFTVHNIALQGYRPFDGSDSSLNAWYPGIWYDHRWLQDPKNDQLFNPMATGCRLADMVHIVSPSYAEEVLAPSDGRRFTGGEGLEGVLSRVRDQGRLVGISNGCDYSEDAAGPKENWPVMLRFLREQTLVWAGRQPSVSRAHLQAFARLTDLIERDQRPAVLLTSVSRLVWQKCWLLKAGGARHESGIHGILDAVGDRGVYILLGTGVGEFEPFFMDMADRCPNFIFLNGFSGPCADRLYANGDLFLMPSSYEPCGLSQMYAMREGQPCVVHKVGGLKDTVQHHVDGFHFEGWFEHEQVDNFVDAALEAVDMKLNHPGRWADMCAAARQARFPWEDAARQYVEELYAP